MKKELALLAVSMSTSLIADSCCDPCPTPCCVPKPREPICCECYTPPYYNLQCDWGLYVTADFLYWYARESELSYAAVGTLSTYIPETVFTLSPGKYKHFNTNWRPGFRIGLGWNMDDGWDLFTNWTYYTNEKKNSTSVTAFTNVPAVGGNAIINPWSDLLLINTNGAPLFDSVSAKWHLRFNQIDLEMGRRYWLSKCFTMRPYAGLRGAWTKTKFNLSSHFRAGVAPQVVESTMLDRFKNRNWGVGLLAGFQPTFYFTEEFSLYANADIALLWGEFKGKIKRVYPVTVTGTGAFTTGTFEFRAPSRNNAFGMQSVLDLALGLRWDTSWCDDRFRFEIDAGWEHHIWLDYIRRIKVSDPSSVTVGATNNVVSITYDEVTTNLDLGGFVLRVRFDF